jgi:hypothetical protein
MAGVNESPMKTTTVLYNVRPEAPPRTQVPWLTQKRCYRDAGNSKAVVTGGQIEGKSEYHDEFKYKETTLDNPVLIRDDNPSKVSKRVYPDLAVQSSPSDENRKGVRHYPAKRSSSMPWLPPAPPAPTQSADWNSAITTSPGLRAAPFNGLRDGVVENPRPRGLRSSPYADKFLSSVF